jgi:hypothetical protein
MGRYFLWTCGKSSELAGRQVSELARALREFVGSHEKAALAELALLAIIFAW